jgi:uncharacterized protein (DUF1684 family)
MPWLRTFSLLCVGLGLLACESSSSDNYEQTIMQARVKRDMQMREKESVLPPNRRDAFQGLDFYEVDSAYRFEVPFRRAAGPPDTVTIAENTGELRSQVRAGEVTIPLPVGPKTLVVFEGESDTPRGRLWIPFADATNGQTTYSAGRYVDLEPAGPDSVVVDFNRAYNPTCTYNPNFACPLPPSDNRLGVPIPAGEKKPSFDG